MVTATGADRWHVLAATALGSRHVATGAPNQDAFSVVPGVGAQAQCVAAIADGHGGARYFRSETGARLAVDIAVDIGGSLLEALDAPTTKKSALGLGDAATRIVQRWSEAVRADLAAHPVGNDELAAAGVAREEHDADDLRTYGATLLLAVMGGAGLVLLQIGDGDIVVVDLTGRVTEPVPGDPALVAGETTSLCLPDAASSFRSMVLDTTGGRAPVLVLLSTDGFGNSYADRAAFHSFCTGVLERVAERGVASVEADLPSWIAESARVAGDDVTVVALLDTASAPASAKAAARAAADRTVAVPTTAAAPPAGAPPPSAPPRQARAAPSPRGSGAGAAPPWTIVAVAAIVRALARGRRWASDEEDKHGRHHRHHHAASDHNRRGWRRRDDGVAADSTRLDPSRARRPSRALVPGLANAPTDAVTVRGALWLAAGRLVFPQGQRGDALEFPATVTSVGTDGIDVWVALADGGVFRIDAAQRCTSYAGAVAATTVTTTTSQPPVATGGQPSGGAPSQSPSPTTVAPAAVAPNEQVAENPCPGS